eukprot:178778-Prymnesium_polylepis.1
MLADELQYSSLPRGTGKRPRDTLMTPEWVTLTVMAIPTCDPVVISRKRVRARPPGGHSVHTSQEPCEAQGGAANAVQLGSGGSLDPKPK